MKYSILLIIIAIILPGKIMADDTLELLLTTTNDSLVLEIHNATYRDVYVNKRFALGPANSKHSEIAFIIRDRDGNRFEFNLKQKLRPLDESDLCKLTPGMLIGKNYKLTDIVEGYRLTPGKYDINAEYQNTYSNEKGVFTGKLESNWQQIVVK